MDQLPGMQGPELPKPEHLSNKIDGNEVIAPKPELGEQPAQRERLNQANNAVVQASSDDSTSILPSKLQPTTTVQLNTTNTDNPQIADDVDVIEKECVQKAKRIVTQTKDDPHKQTIELTKFKSDYINKRYGKEIKLPEEQAA